MTVSQTCIVNGEPCQEPCLAECDDLFEKTERAIEDIKINGNYTRTFARDGVLYRQVFRNHEPVGDPVPRLRLPRSEEER